MDMAMPALGLLPSLRLINWLFGFISGGSEGKASTIAFPLRAPLILIRWRLHAHNSREGGYGANAHIGNGSPLHPPHAFFTWGGASTMPLLLKGGCVLSPFFEGK